MYSGRRGEVEGNESLRKGRGPARRRKIWIRGRRGGSYCGTVRDICPDEIVAPAEKPLEPNSHLKVLEENRRLCKL